MVYSNAQSKSVITNLVITNTRFSEHIQTIGLVFNIQKCNIKIFQIHPCLNVLKWYMAGVINLLVLMCPQIKKL
jgi:hypothetical protein